MEKLLLGVCIDAMQSMPGESLDTIFADPPFKPVKKCGSKTGNNKAAQPKQITFTVPEGA